MDKDFLNKKEPPTNRQILKYFFTRNEIDEMLDSLEYANDKMAPNLKALGEPDEVETASGTEWEISRVKWITDNGPRFLIYLKKVGFHPNNPEFSFENPEITPLSDYTMNSSNDDLYEQNPFFNYNNQIEDIDYEDVEPMSFEEQLELAIENEDFEEAVRLRDWNTGLAALLIELRPKFIKAIEASDLEALDRYHKRLNDYRAKL